LITLAHVARWRIAALACTVLVFVVCRLPAGGANDAIHIWVIGSPYEDSLPAVPAAVRLREEAAVRGYDVAIDRFRARGFAAIFAEAVARGVAPDVLVFDNFGIMDGITTPLGRFVGIGKDPTRRPQFTKVTGVFDELMGPRRGWAYLFELSARHDAAKQLALRAPACSTAGQASSVHEELVQLATDVSTAFLKGDAIGVQGLSDPDRLPPTQRTRGAMNVGGVRVCGTWSTDKLAIATVNAAYESDDALGDARLLLVFRRPADRWQLLVVTRDPVSVGTFANDAPRLIARLSAEQRTGALPMPATLVDPVTGQMPRSRPSDHFGVFEWDSAASDDVVAEIGEFAYDEEARLFLVLPVQPGGRQTISAGQLWTTRREWSWRIWSVSRSGDLAFSEARTFVH
jgi:hypothetical protein